NPASTKWMQVNTNSSKVIFPKGLDSQAQRISNMVQMLDTTTLYSIGNKSRKWNIVLLNQNTEANAFVRLAPVVSELYMVPSQNNFGNGSLRWDDNLIIHENRHMQQFSNFNHGFTKVFSFLFGQEGQLLANGLTIPDYFFEGDAVFQETLVSRQGRGRMPSFYNSMKALWLADKKYNWMQLRNGSLRKFIPDHYELGYPVVMYGYEKYGNDFWKKVTTDAVDFKGLFYSYNKAVQKYSGKSYQQFTKDALEYYKEKIIENTAKDNFNFITPIQKNNVVDYLYPQFVSDDTIIVTKQSYKELNSFYFLINGKEKKIRVKDYVLDDYFSYNNGKVVYASYKSDPRWDNRNYSVINLLDIYTNEQVQLTDNSNYFSPDINKEGTEMLAVKVNADGSNYLHRLNAVTGELIEQVPNPENYFFTQTKYIDAASAVSAVRSPKGQMALVKIDFADGSIEQLTSFTYAVLGYPCLKEDMVYFSMTDDNEGKGKPVDRVFAVSLTTKKLYRVTNNINGVYQPAINTKGGIVFSAVTADGNRLAKTAFHAVDAKPLDYLSVPHKRMPGFMSFQLRGVHAVDKVSVKKNEVKKYSKATGLFNFHSARPFADDPEFGYTFYSDNALSNFHSEINYTYNRNEQSHAVGYDLVYSGLFPFLRAGIERSFNREVDTGSATVKLVNYNSTKINAGLNIPLRFINGRTFKFLNIGGDYNVEYIPAIDAKGFGTKPLKYLNTYFVFSNRSRTAKQFINPQWAQTFTVTYRDAFNLIDNYKLFVDGSLYFPGLFRNHSLQIDGAFQQRDTLVDFFSKTFSTPRGYQDLNQRRMYKIGVNYHLPLCYPDWGFGNIIFFQRIRMNAFFDYGSSQTLFTDGLREIKTRSTGAEVFFDTKFWNALPVSFGVRYSRLLDRDYLNVGAVNRWEIVLPLNIIPD
ncbi:MAG: hypothetical protein V4685_08685, partial [Bacteroidota bacterium]